MILDAIAGSKFGYRAGVDGAVTVAAGFHVTSVACHASAAGATLVITPGGAAQEAVDGDTIAVPPGWFSLSFLTELGPGTKFTFVGTDSWVVTLAKFQSGAAK